MNTVIATIIMPTSADPVPISIRGKKFLSRARKYPTENRMRIPARFEMVRASRSSGIAKNGLTMISAVPADSARVPVIIVAASCGRILCLPSTVDRYRTSFS